MIYTTIDQLPPLFEDYLTHYHQLAFVETSTNDNYIKEIIAELRLAYRKYPEHKERFVSMGHILNGALKAKPHRI